VVEEQAVELCQKDQALEAKDAELQRKKEAVTTLTITLTENDVVLEAREVAIRNAETTLKEREVSLSVPKQQADAARAKLEEAQECIKGKYLGFLLKLIISLPKLIFVFSFRAEEGGGGRDLDQGSCPGRVYSGAS